MIETQQPVETEQKSRNIDQTEILQFVEPSTNKAQETTISEITMVESVSQQKPDSQFSQNFANFKETADEQLKQYDIRQTDTVGQIPNVILSAVYFSLFSTIG